MTTQSACNNQKDIFHVLDKVAETGVPLEIKRKGKRLFMIIFISILKYGFAKNLSLI